MKNLGIIGGVGPETTTKFYLQVVSGCQKINKEHRPLILIYSLPLPFAMEEEAIVKNIGLEKYIPFLKNAAVELERSGADFLVMPCNSLHVFIKEIRDAVKIPVLSILEETVNFLKKENVSDA